MGRAAKNMHRHMLAGNGKENQRTMPEHKVKMKEATQSKGTSNAPAKTRADHTK